MVLALIGEGVNPEYFQIPYLALSFFFINTNDIYDDIPSDLFLFADDSLLLDEVVATTVSAVELNCDLYSVLKLASKWLVTMKKTKSMIFSSKVNKRNHLPVFFPLTI